MAFESPRGVYGPAAHTSTGVTGAILPPKSTYMFLIAKISSVSGVTPTLTLGVEWSHDGGTTWAGDSSMNFSQFTAADVRLKKLDVAGTLYRLAYTIGGVTPSFTITVSEYTTT